MNFDAAAVEAEVRAAFDGYEAALGANDVAALTGYFWQSPRAVRLMTEGGLYGIESITAEYLRTGSGRRGAQSQVWVRRPEGWRIASAHVSLGAAGDAS